MEKERPQLDSSQGIDTNITKEAKQLIVDNIGGHLQMLGRALDLTLTELAELKEGKEPLTEKAHNVIETWIQNQGEKATKRILMKALITIGRKDIADLIKDTTSKCEDGLNSIEFENLRQHLAKMYSTISIPQPPKIRKDIHIDEIFIDQDMENRSTAKQTENEMPNFVHIEELFQPVNGKQPTRILVEGDPGFGKTTLAVKLATDWANKRKYISSLFNLVMLISLREMGNQKIDAFIVKVINQVLQTTSVTIADLSKFLVENKVLLILDGFDEISEGGREHLRPILLNKEEYQNCILVTSRRGVFTMRKTTHCSTSFEYFKENDDVTYDFCDTHIQLKGFNDIQRKQLLTEHFNINPEKLESKLNELFSESNDELFRCPLFVFWLGWMLEKNAVTNIQTRSLFYKALFNAILHKTLVRKGKIQEKQSIDIFQSSTDELILLIQADLRAFGRLALDRLVKHDLSPFKCDDILCSPNSILFESDIIMKFNSMKNKEEETVYQPMHKSFSEFLAAFSVWSAINNEPSRSDQFQTTIRDIVKKGLLPSEESMFFPFLVGLMETKAHWLFQSLSPWSQLYHACTRDLLNVLVELTTVNDDILQSLMMYVPSCYQIIRYLNHIPESYYSSEFHRRLFESALESISVLFWDVAGLNQLPLDKIKVVGMLFLETSPHFVCNGPQVKSIQCDEFVCYVTNDMNQTFWDFFLSFYNTIQADQRHLLLNQNDPSACTIILNEMILGQWRHLSFQRVCIDGCSLNNENLKLLIELVRKKSITKGIFIQINRYEGELQADLISQLWEVVVQSTIDEFTMINHDSDLIPIFDFTWIAHGKRTTPFEMIQLPSYFTVKLPNELHHVTSINELCLTNYNYVYHEDDGQKKTNNDMVNLLTCIRDLIYLQCHTNLFCSALRTRLSFFTSLNELCLFIDSDFSFPPSFCAKDHLPSLRTLKLQFNLNVIPSSLSEFLSSLYISQQLQVLDVFVHSNAILGSLMSLLSTQKPSLDCLQLSLYGIRGKELIRDALSSLKYLLQQKYLKYLRFVDIVNGEHILRPALISVFPEEEFLFKCELAGDKDDDTREHQSLFKRHFFLSYRLCVELKK